MGRNLIGKIFDGVVDTGRTIGNTAVRAGRGVYGVVKDVAKGTMKVVEVAGDGINYIGGKVKSVSTGLNKVVKAGAMLTPVALAIPGLGEAYVAGLGAVAGVAGSIAGVSAIIN